MKYEERTLREQNKKNLSMKAMYFNRYLLVRYTTALFFFTNIYWLISLVVSGSSLYVIPLLLLVILLFSIAEQVRLYGNHTNDPKYTRYCYIALLVSNIVLFIPASLSSYFTELYPFLSNQGKSKLLVAGVLVLGILLSTFILNRLNCIKRNEDKHYQRIKNYEEAMN